MSVESDQMINHLMYRFYQLTWQGLDWVYPPRCGGCGQKGSRWCKNCRSSVHTMPKIICEKCGLPVYRRAICQRCLEYPPRYNALRSWAIFDGPVRNALHRLKYHRDIALGDTLATQLMSILANLQWDFDCVVPVPLGEARLKERGYNQSKLLAWPIAMRWKKPMEMGVIRRVRETRTQVGLKYEQRQANVTGAFMADKFLVKGCTVLVIDDVATSGATVDACASALLDAGAKGVYCLTLARAI